MNAASHAPLRQRHPALDLLSRYRAILAAAWAARHELAGPQRLADEAAFLPAALSLQATPAHPAPRRAALAICALFVIAIAWSILGHVDIVAVAPGRIVVSERTKTLQPLEAGVVRRVLVKDGDSVQAGQVLVELDATNATADGASVNEQLAAASAEALRAQALLTALATNRPPALAEADPRDQARDQAREQASCKPSGRTSPPGSASSRPSKPAARPSAPPCKSSSTSSKPPCPSPASARPTSRAWPTRASWPATPAKTAPASASNKSATWPPSAPASTKPTPRSRKPSTPAPPTWPKPAGPSATAKPRPA